MAILDNNIPQPIPPGTAGVPQNWIVSPGLLTKMPGADGSQPIYIPLSTNSDYQNPPSSNYVNLNKKSAVTGNYPIIPTGEELRATWVNVLQDPSTPASVTNPIVGRYAFWMDDENAKININTAYGKPASMKLLRTNPLDRTAVDASYDNVGFNALRLADPNAATSGNQYLDSYPNDGTHMASGTVANAVGTSKTNSSNGQELGARLYPLWHPSAVNLDVLGSDLNRVSLADWIFNGTWNSANGCVPNAGTGQYRPLAYPEQVMQFVNASNPNFYQTNKFNLTTYNRAPEFNAFGKPRLLPETRIRTRTASPTTQDSMDTNAASGAELEFYQTPDLDPMGPMYFHGTDNERPNSSSRWSDLTSVQMVGDYLSGLLAKNNWPGMPARSFVDKWGGDDTAKREADQVAWNIVAMENYATGVENCGPNTPNEWPDAHALSFMRTTQVATADSGGNISPNIPLVSQLPVGSPYLDPNYCLRYGALSHKAIMPFTAKPYANEVALVVTAIPTNPTNPTGAFNLELEMEVELYVPKRFAPGTFWQHFNLCFNLTHFYYTVSDSAGHIALQAADGYSPGYGDGGTSDGYGGGDHSSNSAGSGGSARKAPYINFLAGAVPSISGTAVWPADSYQPILSNKPVYNADGTIKTAGSGIWVCSGTAMQNLPTKATGSSAPNPLLVPFQGQVHVQAKARLFLYANTIDRTYEIVPVWDNADCSLPALKPPTGQGDSLTWDFSVDLSAMPLQGGQFTRSLEVADSRLGGMTKREGRHRHLAAASQRGIRPTGRFRHARRNQRRLVESRSRQLRLSGLPERVLSQFPTADDWFSLVRADRDAAWVGQPDIHLRTECGEGRCPGLADPRPDGARLRGHSPARPGTAELPAQHDGQTQRQREDLSRQSRHAQPAAASVVQKHGARFVAHPTHQQHHPAQPVGRGLRCAGPIRLHRRTLRGGWRGGRHDPAQRRDQRWHDHKLAEGNPHPQFGEPAYHSIKHLQGSRDGASRPRQESCLQHQLRCR